jgi:hypothetical protein
LKTGTITETNAVEPVFFIVFGIPACSFIQTDSSASGGIAAEFSSIEVCQHVETEGKPDDTVISDPYRAQRHCLIEIRHGIHVSVESADRAKMRIPGPVACCADVCSLLFSC